MLLFLMLFKHTLFYEFLFNFYVKEKRKDSINHQATFLFKQGSKEYLA